MSRILSEDTISVGSQYDFDMGKMTVVPKDVTPPNGDNERKEILGLDSILNPFKVNLSPIQDIRQIGSAALGQAISKIRKSPPKKSPVLQNFGHLSRRKR